MKITPRGKPYLTLGIALGIFACTGSDSYAEISSKATNGLNTTINGVVGGSCNSGTCNVTGGAVAGKNRFHRFSSFDTRGAIKNVNFNLIKSFRKYLKRI